MFRNPERRWIMGFMGCRHGTDATQPKILALAQGLQLAVQHDLVPLEISIDCIVILSSIKMQDSKYENIIADYRVLL